MPRKRFSVEQIINHLREAEVLLAQGKTVGEICRRIGVSEQSYYRWRRGRVTVRGTAKVRGGKAAVRGGAGLGSAGDREHRRLVR